MLHNHSTRDRTACLYRANLWHDNKLKEFYSWAWIFSSKIRTF